MSRLTTDPNDPRLTRGEDAGPVEQAEAYLVMDPDTAPRIRPLRLRYIHLRMADGSDPPMVYRTSDGMVGCGTLTIMSHEIADTYARDPTFYTHTFCVGCKQHLPVGAFSWDVDHTAVGS